jgi:DNA mismatch repair protein MutS
MSTPVQRQYWELKKQNPDAVLFFRLGDFYEMFFEDAQLCSRLLGIVLTARHKGSENEMPMCGFPYHAHEEYLEKLVELGYKVSIAEQKEDPKTKVISREIVRVVTPGTSLEKGNLEPEKNSYLIAIDRDKTNYALAYSDISTGDFRTALFEDEISFFDELYLLSPREILVPSDIFEDESFCKKLPRTHLTPRKKLKTESSKKVLMDHFRVKNLSVFGIEKLDILLSVSSSILVYLEETQKADLSHVATLTRYSTSDTMQLDAQTFRHLEVFQPFQNDENQATLWSVFEKSLTAMGARKLYSWLASPLLSPEKINERLSSVEELQNNNDLTRTLTQGFKSVADLERLLARLVTGRGNARDLAFLRDSFSLFPVMADICAQATSPLIREKAKSFTNLNDLIPTLQNSLVDAPPLEITAGGMFAQGYNEELDELREMAKNAEEWLDNFLKEKKRESGIQNLRIKFSKNFGFCLEVSQGQKDNVPTDWVRRQTLVNAERFTTPELALYEERVLSAESKAFELEHKLFHKLREEVLTFAPHIQNVAKAIAEVDALLTLSRTASKWRWNKPSILENSSVLEIEKGRHPVVEKISTERFIANDLEMDTESSRFHLITGPNMSGKSTFLRQNAILILLAQIGSFVPAKKMETGIVDRIFTRVGASDNLAGGKSTFFVEMSETARILRCATERSFVILDEIGRGTSTFDGISLAWAITEFLHDKIKAKTLFATHFHELVDLTEDLSSAQNFHVSATQNENGITFLHRIAKGGVSDSFGINVAENAGVPAGVITNAKDVLSRLESENLLSGKANLFSNFKTTTKSGPSLSDVDKMIDETTPEDLSPREALTLIYQLKERRKKS